jgi:hypothetical protein
MRFNSRAGRGSPSLSRYRFGLRKPVFVEKFPPRSSRHCSAFNVVLPLLLLPFWIATSTFAQDSARPLRVVTYNVLHGGPLSGFKDDNSHLEARLDMAIRELETLEPDIIALQEASQSRRHGNVPERASPASWASPSCSRRLPTASSISRRSTR